MSKDPQDDVPATKADLRKFRSELKGDIDPHWLQRASLLAATIAREE